MRTQPQAVDGDFTGYGEWEAETQARLAAAEDYEESLEAHRHLPIAPSFELEDAR